MRRCVALTAACGALSVPGVALGGADIMSVFIQTPNQANGVFSDNSDTSLIPFQRHADSFVLDEDARIGSVRFWGAYFNDGPYDDTFTIRIHTDDATLPNNTVPDEVIFSRVASVTDRTLTGERISGLVDEYEYRADLNGAFTALAGQRYWISILNNDGGTGAADQNTWFWETSFDGDQVDANSFDNGQTWEPDKQGDLAFELFTVPAPGAATVVILGGAFAGRRRR